MASNSDDETMQVVEETVGRRTRSGRAVKSPIASVPTPRTRGSKKKVLQVEIAEIERHQVDEDVSHEIIEREMDSASENSNGLSQMFQSEETTVPQYLESDSNQSEGRDIPFPEISQDFLNNSSTVDFTITEENANSFQSMDVEDNNINNQIIEMNDSNIANSTFDLVQKVTSEELLNVKVEKEQEQKETVLISDVIEDKLVQKFTIESVVPKSEEKDVKEAIVKSEKVSIRDDIDDVEMKDEELKASRTEKEDSSDLKQDSDTEMVSEDELPAPPKAKVPEDTEEVSDDELPGPRLAELPEDTEVVSEDELPSVKAGAKRKREEAEGYNPGSPTEETTEEKNPKRPASENSDKEKEEKKTPAKPRKLPELDKYWKAVNDDPADFTGWTYLLQYVDQENEIEPAREAYDAFLAHYPYCYGYWRKYSDYEKRKGNKKKCEEVFERGLKAIPLSVDLWLHFLTYLKTTYPDDETRIREQFERALSACGLEFRSDRLWEAYIKWETEGKRLANVMKIYDRLLATPTLGYTGHFDSFQEFIGANPPTEILPAAEFIQFRQESRDSKKDSPIDSETPPGEEEADDNIRNDEECEAIRELIISSRRKIHKVTVNEVTARWSFEEGIKRPYFHVKPLERCQINNWKEYLDFEIQKGDRQRVLILYERALIACALYDEFWLRLIRYLETQNDPELVSHNRDVFERACLVHHPDKPNLHLLWAAFEEGQSNYPKAAEILTNLEKTCPNLLQVSYRRINLERRRGDYEKVCALFENYIQSTKNKTTASGLVIKYARFTHKIRGDMEKALEIIKNGIEKDPSNARLYLQAVDLAMQREKVDEKEIVDIMDTFLARDLDPDQKVLFAQRKLEFLEDFGTTAEGLQAAMRGLQQALVKANKKKEKGMGDMSPSKKSKDSSSGNPPLPPSGSYQGSNSQYGQYGGSGTQTQGGPYGSYQGAAGSYGQGYPQSGGDYSSYNWGQYGQNYQGYGQWGGSYPNYY